MKIRLGEKDIRKMVLKCLNEVRSNGEAEVVEAVNGLSTIAWQWVLAMRDRANGGKGFSEYNGKMYSVDDWYSTMYKFLRPRCRVLLRKFIGDEIKDLSYNRPEKNILGKRDQNDPLFRELATRPNKFIQPSDETLEDIYSDFFSDTSNEKSLYNRSRYICDNAYNPQGAAKLVVTSLKWYVYNYIRTNDAEKISMSVGTGPYPRRRGFDNDFRGNASDSLVDGENIAVEMVNSGNAEDARLRLKRYFETLLAMLNEAPSLPEPSNDYEAQRFGRQQELSNFKAHSYFDKRYGVMRDVNKPYLKYVVKYIVDNFDSVFPSDKLREIFGKMGLSKTRAVTTVKEFVESKVCDAYNMAVESLDQDNDILKIFGGGNKDVRNLDKKTVDQIRKQLEPMWSNMGPDKFGKDIHGRYAEMYAESVDRAVRSVLAEIKKRGC